jgi:hypothetical protein
VCDLVLLKNPLFRNGVGMDIHARSKRTRQWSHISSATLSIGDENLEVMGGKAENNFWVNGVKGDASVDSMVLPASISGFSIEFRQLSDKSRQFLVDLGHGASIQIKTWNGFVSVAMLGSDSEDFGSSLGLLGTYGEGLKMARDNKTVLDDPNAFGQEWQVLANEPKLFHNIEGPQAPEKCEVPTASEMRRRLGESLITREDAEIACGRVSNEDYELCVFDVLATNDKDAAGAC